MKKQYKTPLSNKVSLGLSDEVLDTAFGNKGSVVPIGTGGGTVIIGAKDGEEDESDPTIPGYNPWDEESDSTSIKKSEF